jgi:integrase
MGYTQKVKASRYRSLSTEEFRDFLSSIKKHRPDLYDLVLWCTLAGWRLSDILDLKWSKIVDSPEGMVVDRTQLKTKNPLLFPIKMAMKEVLLRQKKNSKYVFGGQADVSLTGQKLCRICDTYGIKRVSFRELRPTFATHRINTGTPLIFLKN